MEIHDARQKLNQIADEVRELLQTVNRFRDRRSGYIEGYCDALGEVYNKLRHMGLLIAEIERDERKTQQQEDNHEA